MKRLQYALIPLSSLLLLGCFHNEDDDKASSTHYMVSIQNLSSHQVLTPPAVIFHNSSFAAWNLGDAASVGLEKLAEGGDTSDFIADAEANTNVIAAGTVTSAPLAPGETASAIFDVTDAPDLRLSLASMLANTNDAFAGIDGIELMHVAHSNKIEMYAMTFDAGTEANSEAAGTIPGPVDGGTGFDATRDDVDFVFVHPGVVTADDGLSTSVLDESHRWNGPVAKVTISTHH